MDTLLQDTESMARQFFGNDAEVKTKVSDGRTQWWVKNKGKEVLAAWSLKDLSSALGSRIWPKPVNGAADKLIDTKAVAAILQCSENSVGGFVKNRGLKVAERVSGRGGMKPRFRIADVEEWMKANSIRRYKAKRKMTRPGGKQKMKVGASVAKRGVDPSRVQLNGAVSRTTRARLAAFVNRYGMPPFNVTVGSVLDSAIMRELDRLDEVLS